MTRYPEGPAESPGFLLWHATLRWQRAMTAVLTPLGLTHVQFVLLASTWWLNGQGCAPNQADVALQAGTDVKMTSEVLRTLETKGFLARTTDPADSRARLIRITEAGAELAGRAIAAVEQTDLDFFAPTDSAALLRILKELGQPPV